MCLKGNQIWWENQMEKQTRQRVTLRGEGLGTEQPWQGSWFTNWLCKGASRKDQRKRQTLQTGRFGSNKQGAWPRRCYGQPEGKWISASPAEPSRFVETFLGSVTCISSPQPRFRLSRLCPWWRGFWAGSVSGRYSPRMGRGEGAANSRSAGGSSVIMSSWRFSSQ